MALGKEEKEGEEVEQKIVDIAKEVKRNGTVRREEEGSEREEEELMESN